MTEKAEMQELDDLFATARRSPPVPSDDLMARVLADALAEQPAPRPVAAPQPAPRGSWWGALTSALGGGVLAGIGTAAAAGLMIGYVQPAPVTAVADALLSGSAIQSVELIPTLPGLFGEE